MQLLRLKELLGLSLEELRDVIEAEDARGALRAEWHEGSPSVARRREIIEEAQTHIAGQLELLLELVELLAARDVARAPARTRRRLTRDSRLTGRSVMMRQLPDTQGDRADERRLHDRPG